MFGAVLVLTTAISSAGSEPPFVGLTPGTSFRSAPWSDQMEAVVAEAQKGFDGRIYLYVSDPWRGYWYGHRAHEPAYLASGVKLAFMLEVFRQRELGQLSFTDEITYTAEDIRDGAPRVNRLKLGAKISIETLLDWMMRSSDNAASDMLAKHVGLAQVNDGLEAEGITGFAPVTYLLDVRRGIYREISVTADDLTPKDVRTIRWTPIWEPQVRRLEEYLALRAESVTTEEVKAAYERFYATGVNAAPMKSVGLLLEKMCRGELVNNEASREMLVLMRGTRTSAHRLLGELPEGTEVAHKTGSQFRRLCDLGVITLPDGHPLIVAACMKSQDVKGAEAALAQMARGAFDLVQKDHQDP